jgi:hypothetical protein
MKPFERSCLYHATFPMKVIEENNEAEFIRLLETGEWFDHPLKVKRGTENEKQIRQHAGKRSSDRKQSTSETGSGT